MTQAGQNIVDFWKETGSIGSGQSLKLENGINPQRNGIQSINGGISRVMMEMESSWKVQPS